ncbi:MAG: phenylacetate--CoA ligase family protein [Candidatus Aenigmarchaeota archaeon]|nr:phenylacetate--CoA ligase family protein [Candidatus Aenigmarchaeota archaeon]
MLIRKIYYLRKLLKQQWMKKSELEIIQNKMLKGLIEHSYKFVPFYKNLMKKNNVSPGDIKNSEDLDKLPVIKKEAVIKNWKCFFSLYYTKFYDLSKFKYLRTSGTYSQPVKIYWDFNAADYKDMVILRSWINHGLSKKDKIAFFTRDKFETTAVEKLGFYRKKYFDLNEDDKKNLKLMEIFKPDAIHSFANTLEIQAKIKNAIGFDINPKFIISIGEILTKNMRKGIENSFDCNVYDVYGCMETGLVASECNEKSLHIEEDNVIVKTENKNCIVTNLTNYLFPIINYDTEDLILESNELCTCGRKQKIIEVIGRSKDLLLFEKTYYPNGVADHFSNFRGIINYKIKKMTNKRVLVKITPTSEATRKIKEEMEVHARKLFNKSIRIDVKIEEKIKKTGGGKIIRIDTN